MVSRDHKDVQETLDLPVLEVILVHLVLQESVASEVVKVVQAARALLDNLVVQGSSVSLVQLAPVESLDWLVVLEIQAQPDNRAVQVNRVRLAGGEIQGRQVSKDREVSWELQELLVTLVTQASKAQLVSLARKEPSEVVVSICAC